MTTPACSCEEALALRTQVATLTQERDQARAWVRDLQSGMYVNCVYCGHRYGPGDTTPVSMADALKSHVEVCPKHPMSDLRARLSRVMSALEGTPENVDALARAVAALVVGQPVVDDWWEFCGPPWRKEVARVLAALRERVSTSPTQSPEPGETP